jgi:hypothetical protein
MNDSSARIHFFISYRHSEPEEVALALYLRDGLVRQGQTVFIDQQMTVGTDWVREIDEQIASCDCMIVLLSESSMKSPMVQGEVRQAHTRAVRDQDFRILPVRVRYFGPLEYELDSYLGRLQYTRWEAPEDSPRVLGDILRSAEGQNLPEESHEAGPLPGEVDRGRPQPRVDPRILTAPGGMTPVDDPLYLPRPVDQHVTALARKDGQTLVIQGPRQMGKSSLLLRYLVACAERQKPIAFIDCSILTPEDLEPYPKFLSSLAAMLLHKFSLSAPNEPAITSQQAMNVFMEDRILRVIKKPLVVAFDMIDRINGRPYRDDFFSMLRNWHNSRNPITPAWQWLDLVLVISTDRDLLTTSPQRSPFNVVPPIESDTFTINECQAFDQLHGGRLAPRQIYELYKLLHGHPYLLRLAYYHLFGPDPLGFDVLSQTAADEQGPFGEHLRAILFRLPPSLLQALRQVIATRSVPSNDAYHRLSSAGLVKKDGDDYVATNELYSKYFESVH